MGQADYHCTDTTTTTAQGLKDYIQLKHVICFPKYVSGVTYCDDRCGLKINPYFFFVSAFEREREIDRQIIQTFFNLKQMLFSLISSFVGVSCIKKGVGREAPFIFFTKDKSENVKPGFKLNLTQSTTTSNLS